MIGGKLGDVLIGSSIMECEGVGGELEDVLIGPSIELLVDVCTLWCSSLTHCTFSYILYLCCKSQY